MKTYILCNGENFLYGLKRHFLMLNPLCISPPFMEADPITVKLCAPGRGRARRDATADTTTSSANDGFNFVQKKRSETERERVASPYLLRKCFRFRFGRQINGVHERKKHCFVTIVRRGKWHPR